MFEEDATHSIGDQRVIERVTVLVSDGRISQTLPESAADAARRIEVEFPDAPE